MRTRIPDKLLEICDEIDAQGRASLARLAVLEEWFEHPGRLPSFGLWVARRAAGRKGRIKGAAGALLDDAKALLGSTSTRESFETPVNHDAALSLHTRAHDFRGQNELQQRQAPRVVACWPLLLVEHGLALHLGLTNSTAAGHKLAADFCQHHDPKHGIALCGPSRTKIMELVRFMFVVEAIEEEHSP